MENFTDVFVSQMVNSLDPVPVYPTREQKFLAFLILKNLSELCETGEAILHDIESRGYHLNNLPDYSTISLCRQILKSFYHDSMFISDPDCDNRPNWKVVENFDRNKTNTAYKIYKSIRSNVVDKPDSINIRTAIHNRDRKFFLENYDKIFANIPFQSSLDRYKNFLVVNCVRKQHLEYVWNFFESLLDIFVGEAENIEDLKSM